MQEQDVVGAKRGGGRSSEVALSRNRLISLAASYSAIDTHRKSSGSLVALTLLASAVLRRNTDGGFDCSRRLV